MSAAANGDSLDPAAERALTGVFGFSALRPGQAETIADVLAGHPVVAVMPTGAGKSLCYQLPAVILGEQGGVALVVSPLIALMKDQVDGLRARGVAAAALTSAASADEQREILAGMRARAYRLVYVAPERFRSPRFLDALAEVGDALSLLAIDEAHCISEWGHEFRPDYRRLGAAVVRLAPPRLVALTATATPEVRRDIAEQLHMQEPRFHVRGFDRPNLRWAVVRAGGAADKSARLVELVRTRPGGTALVYAATRKNAEKYGEALIDAGMRVGVYHAGLDDGARSRTQDEFMAGELDAIVATNAFGMGVDKADIRVVVHADVPRSTEAYYQEAGRGGRDGDDAECVLLFNHSDVRLQEFLIDASYPPGEVLRGMWKLIRDEPDLGANLDRVRAALPGEPHASQVSTAARILERHGYLINAGGDLRAVHPRELGGDWPELDVASIEQRAQVERSKLKSMIDYAYHAGCRRQYILEYFGDEEAGDRGSHCGACDNCEGVGAAAPLSAEQAEHVRGLLSVVTQLSGRFGRARLAAVAAGTDDDARLYEMPERGILRGQPVSYLKDLLRALEGTGLVETSRGEYPVMSITRSGRKVADGRADVDGLSLLLPQRGRVRKRKRAAKTVEPAEPMDGAALERAERLRDLRTRLAREASVPPYVVLTNKSIDDIARRAPGSADELLGCAGIGPTKLERYGEEILAAITD